MPRIVKVLCIHVQKGTFLCIKFDLFFELQSFTTFVSLLSSVCMQFSMNRTTLSGYILIIKESRLVQEK